MYAKIFQQIYDSSIAEDPKVRFTFMDLIVLADSDGVVDMTHEAISRRTNVPIEWVRSSIEALEKPDPKSRTPNEAGARIVRMDDHRDWGWIIVNFDRFRKVATDEQRREKTKLRVQRHREKNITPCSDNSVTPCNADVTPPYASASASDQGKRGAGKGGEKYGDARIALHFLNEATGRHFRELDTNLSVIAARLSEPEVTLEGVKQMIARQCQRWKGDGKMEEFLRPETLFGKTKFDSYYAAKDQPIHHEQPKSSTSRPSSSQGNDRNAGTYNEGAAANYRNAAELTQKRAGISRVQDPIGPSS